jgi:hypothetical protein
MILKPGDVVLYELASEVQQVSAGIVVDQSNPDLPSYYRSSDIEPGVPIYWSDDSWSLEDEEIGDCFQYVGNIGNMNFDQMKFIVALRYGVLIPEIKL